jgi:ABC-type glycerol-3-phosphate transport system substrate-binding protein
MSVRSPAWTGRYPTTTGSASVRAAAWDFLTFLNTPPSQVTMNMTGSYLPDNIRASDDPKLEAMWTGTRSGRWLDTAYTQLTNLDPAIPGALIGPYDESRTAIRASLEAVAAGTPPPEAIAAANRAINRALADYRPDRP